MVENITETILQLKALLGYGHSSGCSLDINNYFYSWSVILFQFLLKNQTSTVGSILASYKF